MLKSKIHRARITSLNLTYQGSIAIDRQLIEAANLLQYERVEVLNLNNGERFSTYVIESPPGSGDICLNGAAARLGRCSDIVIIVAYCWLTADEARQFMPTVAHVDQANHLTVTSHTVENILEETRILPGVFDAH
jgi:aspartate 1-decarboxylase